MGVVWFDKSFSLTQGMSKVNAAVINYNDVTMSILASQITGDSTACLSVCLDKHKKKHQSPRYWPFVSGIHGYRWIPLTKGQLHGNRFHLMTSSWWRVFVNGIFFINVNTRNANNSTHFDSCSWKNRNFMKWKLAHPSWDLNPVEIHEIESLNHHIA